MKLTTKYSMILTALALAAFSSSLHAVVIIQDTFNDTIGRSLDGRQPSVTNLPNNYYRTINFFGQQDSTIVATGNPSPSVQMSANNMGLINIASNPSVGYVEPATFNIGAELKIGALSFMEIGFGINNGSQGSVGSNLGFEGVSLDSTGKLQLWEAGSGAGVSTTIATFDTGLFGAFNVNSYYNLSYNVDRATGDISLITLAQGSKSMSYDIASTSFTIANTDALIIASAGPGGNFGNLDNLILGPLATPPAAVPEPSTWCFLVIAFGGLMIAIRRRQLN